MSNEKQLQFFDEEILPLYPRLRNYAVMYLSDPQEGEDIAQDVMAQVWSKIELIQKAGNKWAYLRTMADNRMKNLFRARDSRIKADSLDDMEEDVIQGTEEGLAAMLSGREDMIALAEAVNGLRPAYRTVILAYYFYEVSLSKIAEVMDLPYGTVVSYHRRAKAELKEILQGRLAGKEGR